MRAPIRRRWIRLALASLLALAPLAGRAGEAPQAAGDAVGDIHFQTIGIADGLSVVDQVAQDGRGYVWFGTLGQLVRWDGYRPRVYRADADDTRALPPGLTAGPCIDASGQVWMGTSGGVVARLDADADRFDRWSLPAGMRDNLVVLAIAQQAPDRYLVATTRGVLRLDHPQPGRPGRWASVGGIGAQVVNTLTVDAAGRAWAGAHDGLYLQGPGGDSFHRFTPASLAGPGPFVVLGTIGNALWVSGRLGVSAIDLDTLSARDLPSLRASTTSLHHAFTGAVQVDPTHVWLASDNGIVTLDEASGRVGMIQHSDRQPDSLPGNDVRRLLRDRSGLVWAATNNGAAVHDPTRQGVATIARAGNVGNILELAPGRWLVGPRGDASRLQVLDAAAGTLRPFVTAPASLADAGEVTTLVRLPDGSIAAATEHALLHLDTGGRLLSRNDRLDFVTSLRVDEGSLWIGTIHQGLWRSDVAHPEAATRVDHAGEAGRFVILGIGPRVGRQRVVASAAALRLVDEMTGAVEAPLPAGPQDALPGNGIFAITGDARGRIWVGMAGTGLYVLTPTATPGRFASRHFTTRDGLPGDNVDAILFDAAGTAWLSADGGGLVRMDPVSFGMRVLDSRDGATFGDYWSNSAATTSDGALLFGSRLGLTVLRPGRLQAWSQQPPTVVTAAQAGDGLVVGAVPAGGLTVPADSQKFAVEFASLDYSAPSYNRYRYRLDGVDHRWIDTDAVHRSAAYTNLAPGRYRLHLQGSNRAGAWGRELVVPVRVLPAWYQTWWARTLAGAALLGLATVVYALLTGRLRRQRAALERAVDQRTQELRLQKKLVDQKAEELLEANVRLAESNLQLAQANGHLEEANGRLERASTTDALTGLHNRRYLTQCIDAEVAAVLRAHEDGRAAPALSFFMVDLDHFKAVNDVHGHAAGDAVLCEVARRLEAVARASDGLMRWGGEEFLLVARDTPFADAGLVAERICEAMRAAPFEVAPGVRLSKTCSVGFASLPFFAGLPRVAGWAEVVDVADQALYRAKDSGRDGWTGLAAGPA
ncbi:MAG TPA: diguanylate cyclase, partial [Burkholderiaceae bacterium]